MSGASGASTELKIAYIGGGSRGWARKLMIDLALAPDMAGLVSLYDIDPEPARLNQRLGTWLQGRPGVASKWRYEVAGGLDEALAGADFVVLSIQPGPLELMAQEIAIAERHGMYFPVGDTTGAPGHVRGLRSAAVYEGFARRIAAACPRAWVINYSNPMSVCTRTLTRVEPGLKAFGCCHEVFGTQRWLAWVAARELGLESPPDRRQIAVNVLGINHFTLVDRADFAGVDMLALLRQHALRDRVVREFTQAEVEAGGNYFQDNFQVKLALFARWGILPAAGDRHLVEFLPGFTRSPETLFRWGIIRTPPSFRIERQREARRKTEEILAGRETMALDASGEEGVAQMRALLGLGELVTNVNFANRGQAPDLPAGAVVETDARFSRDEVRPLAAGTLPPAVAGIVSRHVANQEMIVEAALSRDTDLAFQAVFADPANRLPVDECWKMFVEMLQAGREYLPGWRIPSA